MVEREARSKANNRTTYIGIGGIENAVERFLMKWFVFIL